MLVGQKDTYIGSVAVSGDKEIRVQWTEVDGLRFLNMREYIPSIDQLGRGLLLPEDNVGPFLKLLLSARTESLRCSEAY